MTSQFENLLPLAIAAVGGLVGLFFALRYRRFVMLMVRNLRRNLLRTTLTALAIFVLVLVVTLVWSMLAFLDKAMESKEGEQKAIVTERNQIPSQMPPSYATTLIEGDCEKAGDLKPRDYMTWSFYGGNIVKEKEKQTRDTMVFFFVMEPEKVTTMLDGMEDYSESELAPLRAALEKMKTNRKAVVLGRERMEAMNKKVGETITVYSMNFKEIDLECEIVGLFPEGRYNQSAVMNKEYLRYALDAYERSHGQKHSMAERALNLVWLKVNNKQEYEQVASQIMRSPRYASPAVKVETASSAVSTFLEGFRDLIWGMRYLLTPAILATMALIISNAISIGVRERRTEMAVLKVLGFGPNHVLALVLGEAMLIGGLSGLLSAGLTQFLVNAPGGFKFPIAFFSSFMIDRNAWWWGLSIGAGTSFLGSFLPAWSARTVKVSDVFSKVA